MAPLMLLMIVGLTSVYGLQTQEKNYLSLESKILNMFYQSSGGLTEDKVCTDCLKFLGDMKTVIASPALAAQIAGKIDMGCSFMGEAQTQCQQMVTALVHSGLTFVSNFFNPTITCDMLAFCSPTPPPTTPSW